MNRDEELTLTYSGVVSKEKRNAVCVRFERKKQGDYAEGILPDARITDSKGFSAEEIEGLENYLRENSEDIRKKAKELNNFKRWFR